MRYTRISPVGSWFFYERPEPLRTRISKLRKHTIEKFARTYNEREVCSIDVNNRDGVHIHALRALIVYGILLASTTLVLIHLRVHE